MVSALFISRVEGPRLWGEAKERLSETAPRGIERLRVILGESEPVGVFRDWDC